MPYVQPSSAAAATDDDDDDDDDWCCTASACFFLFLHYQFAAVIVAINVKTFLRSYLCHVLFTL